MADDATIQSRPVLRLGSSPHAELISSVFRHTASIDDRSDQESSRIRQAIRSQAAARERAERDLQDAQSTIRGLREKLTRECLSRDEIIGQLKAIQQSDAEALQALRDKLIAAHASRHEAEDRLAQVLQEQEKKRIPQLIDARPVRTIIRKAKVEKSSRVKVEKSPRVPKERKIRVPKVRTPRGKLVRLWK